VRPVIGVLDSGVGGLTVLTALKRALPGAAYVYLGDTARNPYGGESAARITAMAREGMRYLLGEGATMLVIACNTITFTALDVLARETEVPCIGMPSEIPALETAHHVAIAATPATIATHIHRDALARHCPQIRVTETACDGLAAAIERGDRARAAALIAAAVQDWDDVDTVLWACTHYPLVADLWQAAAPHCRWIDPAAQVVQEVVRRTDGAAAPGSVRLCFTDERAADGLRATAYAAAPWEVVAISEKRGVL